MPTRKPAKAARKPSSPATPRRRVRPRRSAAGHDKLGGISTEAVRKATGRGWDDWLALLDSEGAAALTHKQIAMRLNEHHGVGPWWSQMVTVGYEQARGRRIKHQMAKGFEVSVSKTVSVPVSRLYACWADAKLRRRWLPVEFEVRKATKNKSMRITWPDGTHVDANFFVKGPAKSYVGVGHAKLADARAAAEAKTMWKGFLEAMVVVVSVPARRDSAARQVD